MASISEYNTLEVAELYAQGMTPQQIAEVTGHPITQVYLYHRALKKGFPSLWEYRKHLDALRQQKPENQALVGFIRGKLEELGESQGWLARQMGIHRQLVSLYAQGKTLPNNETLARMFSILGADYKTLDDLLADRPDHAQKPQSMHSQ